MINPLSKHSANLEMSLKVVKLLPYTFICYVALGSGDGAFYQSPALKSVEYSRGAPFMYQYAYRPVLLLMCATMELSVVG